MITSSSSAWKHPGNAETSLTLSDSFPAGQSVPMLLPPPQCSTPAPYACELEALATIAATIRMNMDRADIIATSLEQIRRALQPAAVGLILHRASGEPAVFGAALGAWAPYAGSMLPTDACVQHNVIGHGHACACSHSRGSIEGCWPALSDDTEPYATIVCVPLMVGETSFGTLSAGWSVPVTQHEVRLLTIFADMLTGAVAHAQQRQQAQHQAAEAPLFCDSMLTNWLQVLHLRDNETGDHSQRVLTMSLRLASALGISETEMVHIQRGVLLHDIGKLAIPDSILRKPGPLTPEEWQIMRQHPLYARKLLETMHDMCLALDIPLYHHERWDGSGYPYGLQGEAIPLAARLFAVVDVWDALRSDRPYRRAWTAQRVRAYIRAQAGTHFDPYIVDVFLGMLDNDQQTVGVAL
jgi:HD-GYP domain-containing protein (c-di-GMP phosphodiesterase class II)